MASPGDGETDGTDTRDDHSVATTNERADPSGSGSMRVRMPRLSGARYSLAGELGHGGMGEVIAARDEQIGREVAVKRMRSQDPTPRQVGRFMREACIQGRLEHPAIVPVHELGRDVDGRPFFAMKKLTGTTLAQILAAPDPETYPRSRLLRAFAEVCLAIELAHTRGVVHRDLKPDNIMLGDFGEVYVLDWGVAKLLGDAAEGVGEEPPGLDSSDLVTAAGAAVGTPGYMAPEQVRGELTVDGRSDVYALGCLLFEILAGAALHPRGSAALQTTVHGIDTSPRARAREREVPPELDALCVAALQLRVDQRLGSARELGDRVQRFLDGDRDLEQRRELARAALAAATTAFASGTVANRVVAMREAGRALALDPTLAGAAELVTRLMLEPPRETPPEVEEEVRADAVATRVANARLARWSYVAYSILLPVLAWTGAWLELGLLSAAIVIAGTLTARVSPTRLPPPLIVFTVVNAALIAMIAHIYTPVLLAPGLAAVTGLILALNPPDSRLVRPVVIIVIMACSCMLPWLIEAVGIIPRTLGIDGSGLRLFGAGVTGGRAVTTVVTALTFITTISLAIGIGAGIRSGERAARLRLRLQAWQLRQLVAS